MFDQAVSALLSGAVICPFGDRESFDYLSREEALDEANRFLGRIGRRVASPSNGGAYFLVHTDPAATKRADVSNLHKKILGEVRPVLGFLDLCMAATRTDVMLRPGDQISASALVAEIDANNKLRSDLQDLVALLPRATGVTNRERFDCVLKRLEGWGYIRLENAEREIYRATGMIELFHDLIAFFIEHTPGAQEFVEAQNEQGSLL
jgi:hypothetical protein